MLGLPLIEEIGIWNAHLVVFDEYHCQITQKLLSPKYLAHQRVKRNRKSTTRMIFTFTLFSGSACELNSTCRLIGQYYGKNFTYRFTVNYIQPTGALLWWCLLEIFTSFISATLIVLVIRVYMQQRHIRRQGIDAACSAADLELLTF